MGNCGFLAAALLVIVCSAVSNDLVCGVSYGGYELLSVGEIADGRGMVASLQLTGSLVQEFGPDILELRMTVMAEADDRLHVHITDNSQSRWEIPETIIARDVDGLSVLSVSASDKCGVSKTGALTFGSDLEFSYVSHPFGFAVTRQPSGDVLFNCTPAINSNGSFSFNGLVFKDQYLEISTQLPEDSALFGLGESTRSSGLQLERGRTYTLWTSDIGSNNADVDLYGAWPFYMEVREGVAHGVLLLNSNGMDVLYEADRLTYRVIGGVLDFYFFAGTTPVSVMEQYTQLVGRPAPMPYWALGSDAMDNTMLIQEAPDFDYVKPSRALFGFHQSHWGYDSVEEVERVVADYRRAEIPLEVIWSDIDYMDKFKDFTLDPEKYPEHKLRALVDKLHLNDQKYVLIIDPGIAITPNYSTFQHGLDMNVYIKNDDGEPYLGQVWPGPVHFPDFLHPNATAFWGSEISLFHERIPFDGLWIDMNEASNFCTGSDCYVPPSHTCPLEDFTVCCLACDTNESQPLSKWDDPPYKINHAGSHSKLNSKTIAMSATHHGGVRSYDAHNLYGLSETILTHGILTELTGKRPFILSRSTFVGSGAYAAHWTGDNKASWADLAYSIVSVLNSGIAGVPMVGADICGFQSDTWEELCSRWIQVGAFYPFARDHSMMGTVPQELYRWGSVAESARLALGLRYRLLPYYYTLLFEAHSTGAPVARPLFFEFPGDPAALNISTQFLVGAAVLVSPVLKSGQTAVSAYFPEGVWYNAFNFSEALRVTSSGGGEFHLLPAPPGTINVHLRHGSIVPMQGHAATTKAARRTPFTLVLIFSPAKASDRAYGRLFLDDGESVEMRAEGEQGTLVEFSAFKYEGSGVMLASVTAGEFALKEQYVLETVQILGLGAIPFKAFIDGEVVVSSCVYETAGSHHFAQISQLHLPLGKDFKVSWESQEVQ